MNCTTNQQQKPFAGGGGGATNCNWVLQTTTEYIYDGRRVIQERDGNNVPTASYTRGNDLSSSLEGAGGIGGLLARSSGYSSGNWTTHTYYHADANGNITYLETSAEAAGASYRYDPFGNLISSSGSFAGVNVYRFSSKEIHVNSGMYYYGYRFHDPNLQRWLNRDPVLERGGINLYGFTGNSPVNSVDAMGLDLVPLQPTTGNCYSYACNKPNGPYIPGRRNDPFPPGEATCANVVAGVKRDHPEWKDPDPKGNCPPGLGKISIFESADHNDFHFHRQDPNGGWSDKQGFQCEPAPILGPVFGPDKNPAYKFCQFLCIKNN